MVSCPELVEQRLGEETWCRMVWVVVMELCWLLLEESVSLTGCWPYLMPGSEKERPCGCSWRGEGSETTTRKPHQVDALVSMARDKTPVPQAFAPRITLGYAA